MKTIDIFKDDQRLFYSLVDSLPFKFYIVDRELNIVVWNKKAEEGPYGVKQGDAVGRPLKDVFLLNRGRVASPRDMESVNKEFREVFEKGTVFCAEDISVLKNGEKRYYQVTKTPLYLEGASVSHVMTIIDDITEKRRREAGLVMSERLFSMRELAAGIVHQLNNPLTTMMVCVESLLREVKKDAISDRELCGRFEKYLETTYKEILRCENVSSMLSKLGTSAVDEVVKTDINRVLTEMLSILTSNRKYSRYAIKTDLEAELPQIMVKENLLRQAFASIILNAFEAMGGSRAGELKVSTAAVTVNDENMIMVSFADNGCELEQTQVNKIFSPFLPSGGNNRVCLGLYVAHAILTEHGGRIEVSSNKETGIVFIVKLPVDLKGTFQNVG